MNHLLKLLTALLLCGCGGSATTNDVLPSQDGGPDGDTDAPTVGCTGVQPATMVTLPAGYAIDSTEVTQCQYKLWLDSQPSTTGQDPACSWNTSYMPGGSDCPGLEWPPGKYGSAPVMCVDWCDAVAYCKTLGKRLCGKIGGGANGYDDYADATKSQWFNACSSGGKFEYPYGDEYDNGAYCDDADRVGGVAGEWIPAGSLPGCQSPETGYSGVFDLSGSVWEWEDSCETIAGQDTCRIRGGSIASPESYASCGFEMASKKDTRDSVTGFRCCSP